MNDSMPGDGRFWLRDYPPGVPADIDPDSIPSLKHLYEDALGRYAGATAYANMGRKLSYAELDEQSRGELQIRLEDDHPAIEGQTGARTSVFLLPSK